MCGVCVCVCVRRVSCVYRMRVGKHTLVGHMVNMVAVSFLHCAQCKPPFQFCVLPCQGHTGWSVVFLL